MIFTNNYTMTAWDVFVDANYAGQGNIFEVNTIAEKYIEFLKIGGQKIGYPIKIEYRQVKTENVGLKPDEIGTYTEWVYSDRKISSLL